MDIDATTKRPALAADGVAWLEKFDFPLHLVAVMGSGRCGKSWFMNYFASLLGPEIFKDVRPFVVRGGVQACTAGVDLLPHVFDLPPDKSRALLLDLEGSGDRGVTHDNLIMVPAFFTCRIIMLHVKSCVKNDELNTFQPICDSIRRILMKDAEAAAAADASGSSEPPSSSS